MRTHTPSIFKAGCKLILILIFTIALIRSSFAQTGSELRFLKQRIGKWGVVMTLTPGFGAKAQIIKGIVAERTLMSDYILHEVMHEAPAAKISKFNRLSDLVFNKNENRWDYISIDGRFTAGIMSFSNFSAKQNVITSYTNYFPGPGFGPKLEGKGMAYRIRNEIITKTANNDLIRQYMQGMDGKEWLGVQYEYIRLAH